MFLFLALVSAYELPNKAKNVRSGIFKWADALSGQRIFLKGQKFTVMGTQLRFDNKELKMKEIGRNLVPEIVAFNASDFIKKALESFTGGQNNSDSSSSEPSPQSAALLDGGASVDGCASFGDGSFEKTICTGLGLGKYTDEKYWGMPMGDFFASLFGYICVLIVFVVFSALSMLIYEVSCQACCCCCCPTEHRSPGLCNLITMVLSCTLMAIATVFYMCGWLGFANAWAMYKSYDEEDGIVVQALDGLLASVKTSFDEKDGFGSVMLPVIDKTESELVTDIETISTLLQSILDLGDDLKSIFTSVTNIVGSKEKTGTIIQLIEENNQIANENVGTGQGATIETGEISNQMKTITDQINQMLDQFSQLDSVKSIPDMINNTISPALTQAKTYLGKPMDSLLGNVDLEQKIEGWKNDVLGSTGFSASTRQYDKLAQNVYNCITGLYMFFGVILFGVIAVWITAFFTYTSCSRCVANCACCCPCCCTSCCLLPGFIGTFGCVLCFYAVTWAVDLGDGSIQGIYSYAFGDELVIPDINLSAFSNGLITSPLHIDPIPMSKVEDITVLDNLMTADATIVKDLVSWMGLDTLIPLDKIADNIKNAIAGVLEGVQIPEDIDQSIQEAVAKINETSIDSKEIFKDINEEKIQEIKGKSNSFTSNKEKFQQNCDTISGLLKQTQTLVDDANARKTDIANALSDFPDKALTGMKDLINHAFGNLLDLVKQLYPALRKVDLTVVIKVFNASLDVVLWTLSQLFVCWSISAHLLYVAMVVSVLMLLVRRKGMLGADFVNPLDVDDGDDSSSLAKPNAEPPVTGDGAPGTVIDTKFSESESSGPTIVLDTPVVPRRSSSSSSSSSGSGSGNRNFADTFVYNI